jgi:hypothetical protein
VFEFVDGGRLVDTRMRARLSPVTEALLIAVAAVGLQALLVPLFAAPNAELNPYHLPIVVAGPAPATAAFVARLDAAMPHAFEIRRLPDQAAADTALRHRDAYAAIVLGPGGPRLRVASAASQGAANLIIQASARLPGGGGRPPVVDVVPAPAGDSHGTAYTLGFLPLALTSSSAGAVLALRVRSRPARLAGLVGFGVLAGLAGALVMRQWLNIVAGRYLPAAMVLALVALAVAATVTGLSNVAGRIGTGLGVIVVFLVGNALSGISSAPQLLPRPWGTVGQFLPPGAGGTLLRSVCSFHGYGGTTATWVLVSWAVAGLALVAVRRAAPPR